MNSEQIEDVKARAKALVIMDEVGSDNPLGRQIASTISHLQGEVERLTDRNVEVSVLASRWMERHDALLTLVPIEARLHANLPPFPSPVDVTALEARAQAAEATNTRLQADLERAEARVGEAVRLIAEAKTLTARLATNKRVPGAGYSHAITATHKLWAALALLQPQAQEGGEARA